MCLAPEVDLVAGAAITVAAVDALRHNPHKRTLGLALLPAIFAVHTFTSAVVWWGLRGQVSPGAGEFAALFFMFVAFVVLPVYLPIAVFLVEPRGWRQFALSALAGAGALSALEYLDGILTGDATATACDFYVDYRILNTPTYTGPLYVGATVGALLLSGDRLLLTWGCLNTVVVVALSIAAKASLPSLWCFWAACTSFFVAWYLRRLRRDHEEGALWPWQVPRHKDEPVPAGR